MKTGPEAGERIRCRQCGKGFGSEVELRIHQKIKHKEAFPSNSENINSSDLSEDEEEGIKRFREHFVQRAEPTDGPHRRSSQEEAGKEGEAGPAGEGAGKASLAGKFNDPSILSDELKKVYLCGCEHKTFDCTAALSMHIKKQHNGFPPEGTLYGVCRQLVRRQFQPIEEKAPPIRPHIEKTAFVCGCGLSYIRISSLRHHIREIHSGQPPLGTLGLSKGASTEGESEDAGDEHAERGSHAELADAG